jgi:hypothetical protein
MDRKRIGQALDEIAAHRKNVRFREIEALLENHIGPLFSNYNHHGGRHHTFTVGSCTFCIAEPHRSPFVKKVYIDLFLDAMEIVGLYERKD